MERSMLAEQVELIRQVFEYAHRFQGKTFVMKIDGALLEENYFPLLVKDLVLLYRQGIRIILVPGAKKRIDEVLDRYHIPWKTEGGVRVSTPEALPFIKMAAFDVSNQLMTQLAANNVDGVIGNWVKARGLGVLKGVDYQQTGVVERVDVDIIRKVLAEGLIPIFPNIGWNALGTPYNISSNDLAAALAGALGAEKLFFIYGSQAAIGPGYRLPEGVATTQDGVVVYLSVPEAHALRNLNQDRSSEEMMEVIGLACRACAEGVNRVHVLNAEIEGVVLKEIFSSRGGGMMIYSNEHENVRGMTPRDIPEVLRIMRPFMEREILLVRTEADLAARLDEFVVYDVDGIIHACGALHPSKGMPGTAEIAAIAVDETYAGLGIGKRILTYLLAWAGRLGLRQVHALTTQTADWFAQFGFREGSVTDLPEERRRSYNRQRNSRVLLLDLPAAPSAGSP
ncbi:MAG TPA: amino-acid N-acetyltransferase [Spirochaetia bacterium]|nr:amino-acid N-acetyltransferase [Spirochaetia bacterium]